VDDPGEIPHVGRERVAEVLLAEGDLLAVRKRREPGRDAAREIVPDGDADRVAPLVAAVEVRHRLDEVVPEKAGPAGDEDRVPRQRAQLIGGVGAEGVEVAAHYVVRSHGRSCRGYFGSASAGRSSCAALSDDPHT